MCQQSKPSQSKDSLSTVYLDSYFDDILSTEPPTTLENKIQTQGRSIMWHFVSHKYGHNKQKKRKTTAYTAVNRRKIQKQNKKSTTTTTTTARSGRVICRNYYQPLASKSPPIHPLSIILLVLFFSFFKRLKIDQNQVFQFPSTESNDMVSIASLVSRSAALLNKNNVKTSKSTLSEEEALSNAIDEAKNGTIKINYLDSNTVLPKKMPTFRKWEKKNRSTEEEANGINYPSYEQVLSLNIKMTTHNKQKRLPIDNRRLFVAIFTAL